jgi:hypothetical protein
MSKEKKQNIIPNQALLFRKIKQKKDEYYSESSHSRMKKKQIKHYSETTIKKIKRNNLEEDESQEISSTSPPQSRFK